MYLRHAHKAVGARLEIHGHMTNCCKKPIVVKYFSNLFYSNPILLTRATSGFYAVFPSSFSALSRTSHYSVHSDQFVKAEVA